MKLSSITGLFIGNIWVYVGVAAVSGIIAATAASEVTAFIKNDQIKDLQLVSAQQVAVNATAALKQFEDDSANIHKWASNYSITVGDFQTTLDQINKDFQNAIHAKPLPPDCKPDATRMRSLTAATAAANKAARAGQSTGSPVPPPP